MAVPSYTEDLTDIDTGLAETTTGYVAYGGGGAGLGAGADFAMQGTNCVDKQVTAAEKGILYNKGAGITMSAGAHVFIWHFTATPGVCDSLVNRGAVINIGSATTAFVKYHVEGNNTYGAGGRVGKCYPIDQTVQSSNTGSVPYRTLVGAPSGTLQYFGSGLNTTATVRSSNMGLDAQRYGTGAYLTAGELISAGDASDDPCTFAGFATQNDAVANRWGIYNELNELQGTFAIGQDNAGTATLCRFEDSDINIAIVDTVHAASDFTKFIIDHASTVCNWTNININAEGAINKGRVIVNSANPEFNVTGGTWTGIGITTLRSNSVIDGLTWRGTDQITCNQAILDNCLIEKNIASSAILTDDLADLTLNNFIGDGTGHAVELSSIGAGTMSWNNTFDTASYATSDGSTGNEAIYVNVGSGSLTINVTSGATTPTIRTAGAIVTVVAGAVTISITAKTNAGVNIENANVMLRASNATGPFPYQESVTITSTGGVATVAHTAHGMSTNDKADFKGVTNDHEYNGVKQITVTNVDEYTYPVTGTPASPAVGTIVSTFVALEGLTNASGVLSTSRTYSTNQPITGWVRKSSASHFYKQSDINNTIDSSNGFSTTVGLISDE